MNDPMQSFLAGLAALVALVGTSWRVGAWMHPASEWTYQTWSGFVALALAALSVFLITLLGHWIRSIWPDGTHH